MAGFFLCLGSGRGVVHGYGASGSRPQARRSLGATSTGAAYAGPPPNLPLVEAPTLGIWSTNDHYLDGERMKMSGRFVKGAWRYEQIEGAGHWIPLDAPDRLNQLLIEWLG